MRWFIVTLCLMIVVLGVSLIFNIMPGDNTQENIASPQGKVSGFWMGLIHGIISPVTFIISLFSDKVNLYDVHNNGGWYNFGFVIGAGNLFRGSCRRKSRKDKKK